MKVTERPIIKVKGKPIDIVNEALIDVRIRHDVNATSMCTFRVVDQRRLLVGTFLSKIGEPLTVMLSDVVCFEGVVTEVGTEQPYGDLPLLRVQALDPSFVLSHQSFFRSFEEQSYSKALQKVAQDAKTAGVKKAVISKKIDAFSPKYLIQEGTNRSFLDDVCSRTGAQWHMRGGALQVTTEPVETHALVALREDATAPKLLVASLDASYSAIPHMNEVEVRGWDHLTKKEVKGTAAFPKASANGLAKEAGPKAKKLAKSPVVMTAAAATSPEEAKALSAGVASHLAAQATRVHGVLAVAGPKLMVDDAVKLDGFGKLGGTYSLTRVEHRFGRDQLFTTEFWAGYRPPSLAGASGAPGEESSMRRNQLDVAVVSDVSDDSGPTRVKVGFLSRDKKLVSAWARVLGLGAGPTRGMHWVPEVGDEVLVGYLSGDPRHPVVVGGLWSGDDKSAPRKKADVVKGGKIVSRTIASRLGSSVEFGDGNDDKTTFVKVGVTDKDMPVMRLGADKADIEVAKGKPLQIKVGDTTITVDKKGNVVIEGQDISLTAKNEIKLDAAKITVTGKTSVDIDGSKSKVALSSGKAEVSSTGTAAVKGSQVQLN